MEAFIPHALVIPFLLYEILQHEMAEWGIIRSKGVVGRSAIWGLFVDLAAGIMGFYGYLLYVAYGYDYGWKQAVGLWAFCFLVTVALQFVFAWFMEVRKIVWIPLLPIFYAVAIYVSINLSWFDLFKK